MGRKLNLHGIIITNEIISNVIKSIFPNAKISLIKRMNRGIMNYVCFIKITSPNKHLILKISNLPEKYGIEKERYIIKILSKKGNVPVPKIIGYDFSCKSFPFKYLVLNKIEGELLEDIWGKLPHKEKEDIAFECGRTLALIHKIRFKSFGEIIGFNKFTKYDNYHDYFYNYFPPLEKEIESRKLLDPADLFKISSWLKSHKVLFTKRKQIVLCHNDFFFWHIFVKRINFKWRVIGVIDFGFAEKSFPESDFVKPDRWIFSHGENIRSLFIEGYCSIIPISKNFKEFLDFFRVNYDLKFYYRLRLTKQEKLAKKYLKDILNRISN